MASFGSSGKNRESIRGIRRRTEASIKRIFATNNSPEMAACASTGSGRDHTESKRLLKRRFIRGQKIVRCFSLLFLAGAGKAENQGPQTWKKDNGKPGYGQRNSAPSIKRAIPTRGEGM